MFHFVRPLRPLRLLPLVPLLAACELDDTVIAPVSPGIVVHAIMRPDQPQQFVLVERRFDGVIDPQRNVQISPPGPLQTPVDSASVSVSNLDLPGDTCGAIVLFDARPISLPPSFNTAGIYWSPRGCPTMRPGDRLALQVEVPGLGAVTGVTRVPGLEAATLTIGERTGMPGDTLSLNRDAETVSLVAEARHQRAMEIVSYRLGTSPPGTPAYLETPVLSLLVFVDSTAVTLPGTVRHAFSRGTGEDAFRGGRWYDLLVAVTDSNYYDFVRSESNEITGRGFINRLQGGIGVFGSLIAAPFVVQAVAGLDDPREGTYAFTGTLEGVAVAVELATYLSPGVDGDQMSGFLVGTWLSYASNAAGAEVSLSRRVDGQSVDGRLAGDSISLLIPTFVDLPMGRDDLREMHLEGARSSSGPFTVLVTEPQVFGRRTVGTLTVTKK
jgi:hypothetical protein